jgi:predicted HicB family RNase H-like nuclease
MAMREQDNEVWVNVRLERDLHERIKEAASRDDRSVSSYVRQQLRRGLVARSEPRTGEA